MATNQKYQSSRSDEEFYIARRADWNLLKVFHVIAQTKGLTRAAETLARKQPAISLALRRLEEQLGVKLCHRGPSGFTLTDEGIIVADTCTKLWGEIGGLNKKIANISADIRGRLNIQVISNLVDSGLDKAIEAFHAAHPLVEIYVAVVTWEVVGRSLLRNESDIGIGPAHQKNPQLQYDPLFLEFHRPYCGPQHPLWGESFEDPRSLANEAFVLTGADEPDELTQFRNRYGLGGIVAGMSEHLEEARRLATLGIGVCFLPEKYAHREVERGKLHALLPPTRECTNTIYVITNPAAPRQIARDQLVSLLKNGQ